MRNEQPDRHADEVNRLAFQWLDPRRDRRFFLFLNYMDVHRPYFMPMGYSDLFPLSGEEGVLDYDAVLSGRRDILPEERDSKLDSYDAEIRFLDDQLALLFEGLEDRGLLEHTVVMIVGDHGESFGEHHDLGHANSVYEAEIHVPMLLLRLDRKGGRVSRTVHLSEAFGAMLEELRLPLPEGIAGATLGAEAPPDPPVAFVTHWPPMAKDYERYNRSHIALFEDPWKLVEHSDGTRELYDLSRDPTETQDLASAEAGIADRLSRRLQEFKARTPRRFAATDGKLDEETLRRLRALGYIN
jgi:arylsulfatase A-like enzyme